MAFFLPRFYKRILFLFSSCLIVLWLTAFTIVSQSCVQNRDVDDLQSKDETSITLQHNKTAAQNETRNYPKLPYSPDLSDFPPKAIIGPGKTNATYVFGIPHIRRKGGVSYLESTLRYLLVNVPGTSRHWLLFVVLLADTDRFYTERMARILQSKFQQDISSGMLQIVLPNKNWYPASKNMKQLVPDAKPRLEFEWSSKQNYDYAYLMLYCASLGQFYMQMEDDVYTHKGYIEAIELVVQDGIAGHHWFVIEFSTLGFIGKLFHSDGAVFMARYLLLFATHLPGDILLIQLVRQLACSVEMSDWQCRSAVNNVRHLHRPSLFQHRGFQSSLKTRIQLLQDEFYRG